MLYGPHHEDVQEVLEFLDQRVLLRRPDVLRDATVKLIGTLDGVEEYWYLPEHVDPDCGALEWVGSTEAERPVALKNSSGRYAAVEGFGA